MLVKEFLDELEKIAPLALQEDYDNSGIQIEGPNVDLTGVLVSLDPTPQALKMAIANKCQMVLTHHPLLFKGVKRLTPKEPISDIIYMAIMNGITIYSAHTNYDSTIGGLNDVLAKKLGMFNVVPLIPSVLKEGAGIGRVGEIESPLDIREFAKLVKRLFECKTVRLAPVGPHEVRKVAICSGAGADFIETAKKAKADVYVTGDVKYHEVIKAINIGLSLVIVEHDESEKFFENEMVKFAESFGIKAFKYHERFYMYL